MKIVVLDGYTLNSGDLSWAGLEGIGRCLIHDRTSPELVVERSRGADAVLTNKVVLDADAISSLPGLKYIGVLATGYDVVDLEAAARAGITVTNVPGYSTMSVVQLAFALLLELTHHVGDHSAQVREGKWSVQPDFSFRAFPLVELDGLILGIVGLGDIGGKVAEVARGFGMRIMAHTRTPNPQKFPWVRFTDIDTLFTGSDVVTLHCPLTPETENLVNAERLAMMKRSAFLINTSRGQLVNEAALAEALDEGRIAGAGLDVLSTEPPGRENPLQKARNCLITPHIAWATRAARERLMAEVAENLRAFLRGEERNVVRSGSARR